MTNYDEYIMEILIKRRTRIIEFYRTNKTKFKDTSNK